MANKWLKHAWGSVLGFVYASSNPLRLTFDPEIANSQISIPSPN